MNQSVVKRQQTAGFTLIEIMLVLVLLSLTAVAVVSTIPNNSKDEAKYYANSFYQRLRLLNEEALLSGKDYGIRFDEVKSTYTVLSLDQNGWQLVDVDKIPAKTELENDVNVQLQLGGGVWQQDDRLFEPGSLFDDQMFADDAVSFDDGKAKPEKPPQLFILSSGEVTPAMVSFYPHQQDSDQGWHIEIKDSGEIVLHAAGDKDA